MKKPGETEDKSPVLKRQDYECGNEISDDCESEYNNAINNGDLDSFYSRCETEGGSSPLRARCALCCNQDDQYVEVEGTWYYIDTDAKTIGCIFSMFRHVQWKTL